MPAPSSTDTNSPEARIQWPISGQLFSYGESAKIKTEQIGSGNIKEVRFYGNTNLLGMVTNPPFNLIWQVGTAPDQAWQLTTVAIDIQGKGLTSPPVNVHYVTGRPPFPFVAIVSPESGAMFASPAQFDFSAELLESLGDAGPVEFFIRGNSIGTVGGARQFTEATSHYSVPVTNLLEGDYNLAVGYHGANGSGCFCNYIENIIRVVRLGIHSFRIVPEKAGIEFEVITSFPGKRTIIQTSTDLLTWLPISTNFPLSNSFTFTVPILSGRSNLSYRALVPQN